MPLTPRPGSLLARLNDENVKETLKRTTTEAVQSGAFGAPTFVVQVCFCCFRLFGQFFKTKMKDDGELFFGADRLGFLADHLGVDWRGLNPDQPSAKL